MIICFIAGILVGIIVWEGAKKLWNKYVEWDLRQQDKHGSNY